MEYSEAYSVERNKAEALIQIANELTYFREYFWEHISFDEDGALYIHSNKTHEQCIHHRKVYKPIVYTCIVIKMARKKIYRARTANQGRNHWLTKVWRTTLEEAELDVQCFSKPDDKVIIYETDYNEYIEKNQTIPRF